MSFLQIQLPRSMKCLRKSKKNIKLIKKPLAEMKNKNSINNSRSGFMAQTAIDYAMSYEEVERILKLYPNNFYEELERYIKDRANG